MSEAQAFTFIDLFSGIGGFKSALRQNGGHCLGFSEINKDAIKAYCENFDTTPARNLGDITKIDSLPAHDILTAGVPCQSWSIAGKNLGFADDRGQLWNDTIYLLQKAKPKAFIFENVKGLVDPRNTEALAYILTRISQAGYHAKHFVINSFEYGVIQARVRIYIIGFRDREHFKMFALPKPNKYHQKLGDFLDIPYAERNCEQGESDLFGQAINSPVMSLSNKNGLNDYFLFNDIRNGETTIHSWDITPTSERLKHICLLLLKNRRKKKYGKLDGNPLSLEQFQSLDSTVKFQEIQELVDLKILAPEEYQFTYTDTQSALTAPEKAIISTMQNQTVNIDDLKTSLAHQFKKKYILLSLHDLIEKGILTCTETRYDFKNTKISTGLQGINRIFLPSSDIFPTLVASDTNDYIATADIAPDTPENYKKNFLQNIYKAKKYRKITKQEACLIQGFSEDFQLPENRSRWMKLVGNSVSVPVIDKLCQAILATGITED